jgi:hypothetical protein
MAKASKPKIYYRSYTEATQDVYDYVSQKYIINMDDWFSQVNVGGKPRQGQTKRAIGIGLYSRKTMRPVTATLNIQVYRMSSDRFELNFYVS